MTLRGVAFPHLLFEWVLSYSRWTYVGLALSETFEALVSGLQGALWTLGAVPAVLRHDNLSAATHELRRSGGRQLTTRFRQVLDHYGLLSSRIQPGKPHENGVAEQSHFRTATAIEQALLLRGERDFVDEAAYLRFVRKVVDEERNAPASARLAEERPYLGSLPSARVPEYTTFQCRVRKWSTIRVGGRVYSVPSRLIGHMVEARQHPSTVEVLYGGRVLCTMPRLRGSAEHRIDYRHIIGSLVRKPGAFARYRFREELFPSLVFRAAYDALGRTHGERADVEYVRVLHLAATTSERRVEATLECFSRCRYLHRPLRLLPAGATVAGRDSHPLRNGAFHGAPEHPLSDPGHPAAQADDRDTHMPRDPEQGRNGRTHRQHRRSARSRRGPAGGAGLVLVRALRGATGRRTSGASTCRASERLGYHVHLAPDDERLAAVHVQARHRLPVALRPWRVLDVAHVRRVDDDRVAGVVTLESRQSRHVSSSALGLDLCR